MSIDEQTRHQLERAATPTNADVFLAKAVALSCLAGGRIVSHQEVLNRLCTDQGISSVAAYHEALDVRVGENQPFDPASPLVVRNRLSFAALEALADLAAQGTIMPVEFDQSGADTTITVRGNGWSEGARLRMPRPRIHTSYRLIRPLAAREDFRFFDHSHYVDGLIDLVGERGARCLREALDAHRRGLHLSAANMLGAASEAAWYNIGESLRGRSPKLDQALDAESTTVVVRLAADQLSAAGGRVRNVVLELQTHEAYLRNLRNYGLHPRSEMDDDHEGAFTETGCALLLMETRRYFTRLRSVADGAGLLKP